MGVMSSLEFVPSDFKIKYVDSLARPHLNLHSSNNEVVTKKEFRVMFSKELIETFK